MFTFIHKTNPKEGSVVIPASNEESARHKLVELGKNPQDYKIATPDEKKREEYHLTSGNPHADDDHSIPEEVHEARKAVSV